MTPDDRANEFVIETVFRVLEAIKGDFLDEIARHVQAARVQIRSESREDAFAKAVEAIKLVRTDTTLEYCVKRACIEAVESRAKDIEK